MILSLDPQHARSSLRIADWEVLPDRHLVRRDGQDYALEPRLMEVLLHLASRSGQVVSRAELLDVVWGETVVQEEALTQAVSQLRRILGDSSKQPAIIETVPKRGYRLVATVAPLSSDTPANQPRRRWPWLVGVAVIMGLVVAFVLSRPDPAPTPLLETFPLTSLPGDEGHPAVSPDGSLVVFAHRSEDSSEFKLHLKRIGSEDLIALTDEPGQEFSPCWSPDAERIAFERRNQNGRRVCVVSAIGGPVQELGPVHWLMGGLDWSPDGRTIVYSCKDKQEAPMRLMRLQVASGRADTLTAPENLSRGDTYPRFSPDGSTLALVRSDRGISRKVYLVPADGGEAESLTGGFFSCGGLDWAPDGKSLILSATLRGTFELWRVDARRGTTSPLPVRIHRSLYPSWSVAGGPLVFADNSLNTDLVIAGIDGGPEPESAAPSTRLELSGRFSPDGANLVFISDRGGSRELWLLDRTDGSLRQLTDFAGDAMRKPRWSPDGRRIAVNVGRDGLLQVVVVDVASGLQRQVTPGTGHHRLGHWSADGDYLFYSREDGPDWRIAKVRLDGTGAVDVPADGCLSLHEQADGGLFYFKETEDGLFWRPDSGAEEEVVEPEHLHDLINLQLTDHGYWFIRTTDDQMYLAFYAFDTGEVRDRVALAGDPTREFHVAAGEREFVYNTVVQTANDLVIVHDPR